jgi:ankyrin repeat protein
VAKASSAGLIEIVRSLIAGGVNVGYRDENGCTALYFASMLGFVEVVMALAAAGADVNTKDKSRNTPLILASGNGHVEVVVFLLMQGVDVNVVNAIGADALYLASADGNVKIVQLLLRHGANRIQYALAAASHEGHNAVVDILTFIGLVSVYEAKGDKEEEESSQSQNK